MLPIISADEIQVYLRSAKPQDWNGITRLLHETWHSSYDHILGRWRVSFMVRSLGFMQLLLDDPALASTFPIVVAETGNEIVGFANASETRDPETAALCMLYILPSHQNLGIGRELMDNTLSRLPKAIRTTVQVLPDNHGAIRFYQRHGFTPVRKSFHLSSFTYVLNMVRGATT